MVDYEKKKYEEPQKEEIFSKKDVTLTEEKEIEPIKKGIEVKVYRVTDKEITVENLAGCGFSYPMKPEYKKLKPGDRLYI